MTAAEAPVDRTGWPSGPWDGEPDRVEWTTEAGLPALVLRQSRGHLCGYVAVPPGHALHGKDYDHDQVPGEMWTAAHGGLTYASACAGRVCHVPAPGEPDDVWWFGFDAAHGDDKSPASAGDPFLLRWSSGGETYRTVEYMRRCCEALARAAAEAARREPLPELGRFAIVGNAIGDITDTSIADEAGRVLRSEVIVGWNRVEQIMAGKPAKESK